MSNTKKFSMWCVVAAVVALCMGLLAGTATVSAQESQIIEMSPPPVAYVPPTVVTMPMPVPVATTPPSTSLMPPVAVVPPAVVNPLPPRPTDAALYQHYLARLFQLKAEIAQLTTKIGIYEVVALAEPGDPFIQYDLHMLWMQLGMMQIEETEIRFVLSTLTP